MSINDEGEEEEETTVVRVPLNMGDSKQLQDVLVQEGLDAGQDWTGDAGHLNVCYEDSDLDQIAITSSSQLGDVKRHAQKLHVFQTVGSAKKSSTPAPPEDFEVEAGHAQQ